MTEGILLKLDGDVDRPLALSYADLAAVDAERQIADVSQLGAKRRGQAVRLTALSELAGVKPTARYVTLHASSDDFHASVPLDAVRDRAVLIYRLDDAPLPVSAGGPIRFFIPNHAACRTDEIDECANVKFVDRIEFSSERGFDNRPSEEEEHAALHRRQEAEARGRGQ
jgi:DMSO/TMAO reductase YedYZ molybdopterin-dependent catalytic subunit